MPAFYIHMFIPKMLYSLFRKLPGIERAMRHGVNWMHQGLPYDPLWKPVFYHSMLYGLSFNQVFPRVYSKEEFARIKAKVLLILGEKESIYRPRAASRAAQGLHAGVEIELVADAHHVSALAQPGLVNQRMLKFLAEEIPQE